MTTPLYILGSVALIGLLSFVGIFFFLVSEQWMRRVMLYLVSFSTGAILGDVFIHILPEMTEEAELFPNGPFIILLGILTSFALEKIIHWHHCHVLPSDDHDHSHHHSVGILSLIGDVIHNFIDGLIVAAAFLVSTEVGIATTIAVILHEIPHEIGNFAILIHSGFTRKRALLVNIMGAIAGLIAATLVLVGHAATESLQFFLLPFAAGNLLYIAGSDLIPELHRQTGWRQAVGQIMCMSIGIGMMYIAAMVEG